MNTTTSTTDAAPTRRYRILRPDSIYVQWSTSLAARSAPMPRPVAAVALTPTMAEAASGWPAPAIILRHVAQVYSLSGPGLQVKKHDPYTVEGKRMAIHLLAASGLGPTAIGRAMRLNHSTVHHHLRHVDLNVEERRLLLDLEGELRRLANCGARGA